MYEVKIIMPNNFNDGKPIPKHIKDDIVRKIVDIAGGITILPGCSGVWKNEKGHLISEPVEVLIAYCTEMKYVWKLQSVAKYMAEVLGQDCVLFSFRESYVGFVTAN